jgi:hypothetical protein
MIGAISVEPHSGHRRAGLLAGWRRMGNFFIANLLTQNPSRRATVCASPLGLFAEFSERLLDQLDGGRGIENFLLIQVDILDAVLAAVGGGNLLFRDIDP